MVCNNPEQRAVILPLSHMKRMATIPGCPMCRLLLSTFRSSTGEISSVDKPLFGEDTVVRVWWDTWATLMRSCVKDGKPAAQQLGNSRRFYTELTTSLLCEGEKAYRLEGSITSKEYVRFGFQLINVDRHDRREFGSFGNGRLLGAVADPVRLKSWMNLCLCEHGAACGHPDLRSPYHPGFKVIDVQARHLVEAPPPHVAYAALSYVWGTSKQLLNEEATRDRLVRPDGLADFHRDIPLTIKDAMILCERMGLRFLWVDALCIRQDDQQDKVIQIANMDAVYSRALVTIVVSSLVPIPNFADW